jgi:UDP-GlcNAc:undecaprenyl-phosphate/decaprenyl-phosphate GlcNAc-1-phosphate transferase
MMDNADLFLILILTFALTLTAIITLRPIAIRVGLTDQPNARKLHEGEIPLVGGLAIFLSVFIANSVFINQNFAYFVASALIVLAGAADDYKNLTVKARLTIEILASLVMIEWGDIEITSFGNLLGFGEIQLGIFSTPVTILAILIGLNSFNLMDGIDGLAGSLSLSVFFCLLMLGGLYNNQFLLIMGTLFIPAILAFLFFNIRLLGRKKASIFLGDTGSMLLGFTISCLVIEASQGQGRIIAPVTVLWMIAIPVFDMASIAIRRVRKGYSIFAPDREHFHHVFPAAGYGVNETIGIILSIATILELVGLVFDLVLKISEWQMFFLFIFLFALYHWGVSRAWKVMKAVRYIRDHTKERRGGQDRRDPNARYYTGIERREIGSNRRKAEEREIVSSSESAYIE